MRAMAWDWLSLGSSQWSVGKVWLLALSVGRTACGRVGRASEWVPGLVGVAVEASELLAVLVAGRSVVRAVVE